MIARENLEDRKQKLANHVGVLALEKLECIERAEGITEEIRQSIVLLKVFDKTLTDLKTDEAVEASMDEQLKSMAAKIVDLESKLGAAETFLEGCSKEVEDLKGNNDEDGDTEPN